MKATILHADLDAFYASVEQLLDPSLRGIPMAVGEGVVLAASYEARAFGIHSAMPTNEARRLCPTLRVVSGSFGRYLDYSDQVMEVFRRFTPDIEQISVDEAFLDVSGSEHLFGPAGDIAREVRRLVRLEIGLPVSIGVATTKFLAKVGSQVAKPDGLIVVEPGTEMEFLSPLPVEILWGVGPVTSRKLRRAGIETVGDIAAAPVDALAGWLGRSSAEHLSALAANRDPRPVRPRARSKSIGSQQALGRGLTDMEELDKVVLSLSERIGRRLRNKGREGRTVNLRARFPGGRIVSRSETLDAPISGTDAIDKVARRLLRAAMDDPSEAVTLVGLSVSGLMDGAGIQMELGWDEGDVEKAGSLAADAGAAVDRQIDEIRRRFGDKAVTRAGLLGRADRDAPEDFRRLAEKD
ncbi:MAG TPA: DNA polymerase IV [Acidimicrobiia bacterium]|nr:DNA polymerase IV [Acidimicrobiia bacterium]